MAAGQRRKLQTQELSEGWNIKEGRTDSLSPECLSAPHRKVPVTTLCGDRERPPQAHILEYFASSWWNYLVRRSITGGAFVISPCHSGLALSLLPTCGSNVSSQLLLQHHAQMHDAMLATMRVMYFWNQELHIKRFLL